MQPARSKQKKLPSLLLLPGEESWQCWRRQNDNTWQLAQPASSLNHSTGLLGIPTQALFSSPFTALIPSDVPATDTAGVFEATSSLRWQALGIDAPAGGRHWICWQVAADDLTQTALIASMALAEPEFDLPPGLRTPVLFTAAMLLYPLPDDGLVIGRELGRYTVAFVQHGKLLHAAVLSSPVLNADAAAEIHNLQQLLSIHWELSASQVQVWTAADEAFCQTLQTTLEMPVNLEARPAPLLPETLHEMLPEHIALQRIAHQRQRRLLHLLLTGVGGMALAFATWAGWLLKTERSLERGFAEVQARQPQVEEAQQAQLQWWALESALDRDAYPLEIFRHIVTLLPAEGIRFREFSLDTEKLVISGEASSLIHASRFQSDLKSSEPLKRFTFTAPQPTILDDNRANFRVEGTPATGGTLQ